MCSRSLAGYWGGCVGRGPGGIPRLAECDALDLSRRSRIGADVEDGDGSASRVRGVDVAYAGADDRPARQATGKQGGKVSGSIRCGESGP